VVAVVVMTLAVVVVLVVLEPHRDLLFPLALPLQSPLVQAGRGLLPLLQGRAEITLCLVPLLQREAVEVGHQLEPQQVVDQAEVLEERKRQVVQVTRRQLRHLKEIMAALVRPPLAEAEVAVQVKQVILMVFVMVVTALRHLLLERLSSMLVVAAVALNLRLLGH